MKHVLPLLLYFLGWEFLATIYDSDVLPHLEDILFALFKADLHSLIIHIAISCLRVFISLFFEMFDLKKSNKIEMIGNVNPKASWLRENKYWDMNIEKKLRNYLLRHLEFSEELKLEILLHEMISKTRFAILDRSTFKTITLEKSKYLN